MREENIALPCETASGKVEELVVQLSNECSGVYLCAQQHHTWNPKQITGIAPKAADQL